ncbi:MAG TPA: hypothetical protein VNE63_00015 [Candidatus Acidoferrales bacterium]|nr:hypothetical protein [Candidatus Acidoferrales bacterium]
MTLLILSVLVAVALFISILVVALKTTPKKVTMSSALLAVSEMVELEGLSLKNPTQVFDDAEYRILRSNPALTGVAKRFRKQRQELALMWLSLLLSDLQKLSRFRGFLIRSGLPAKPSEEIEIFYTFVFSVFFLNLLKSFVRVLGPFALHGTMRRARLPVERMSYASARLLNRLPSAQWQDIARGWQDCKA